VNAQADALDSNSQVQLGSCRCESYTAMMKTRCFSGNTPFVIALCRRSAPATHPHKIHRVLRMQNQSINDQSLVESIDTLQNYIGGSDINTKLRSGSAISDHERKMISDMDSI